MIPEETITFGASFYQDAQSTKRRDPVQAVFEGQPDSYCLSFHDTLFGTPSLPSTHGALVASSMPLLEDNAFHPPAFLSAQVSTAPSLSITGTRHDASLSPAHPSVVSLNTGAVMTSHAANAPVLITPTRTNRAAPSRRSKYSGLDWEGNRDAIHRVYMVKEMSLKETMDFMAKSGFIASEKLYKDKFKEWGWCKNISAATAQWMLGKADARKLEKHKETVFVISGRVWTIDRIQKSARRGGWGPSSEIPPVNASTPHGVTYGTPLTITDHPSPVTTSPKTGRQDLPANSSPWTPIPEPSQTSGQNLLRLSWNGCTKEKALQLFRDAQESDQQGEVENAENQFREALGALQHIVSPTHADTNVVAYSIAGFYARRGRMDEADKVLDWMSNAHIESLGVDNKLTQDHVLYVVELLTGWFRPQDALSFLERFHEMVRERKRHNSKIAAENESSSDSADDEVEVVHPLSAMITFRPAENPTGFPIGVDAAGSSSSNIDRQLRSARAQVRTNDEAIEPVILSIIAQCQLDPVNLAVQDLHARADLIELYQRLRKNDVVTEELSKAQAPFLATWSRADKLSRELIESSLHLATLYLKSEQFTEANDMFQLMQERMVELLGPDHIRTTSVLIQIGLLYQNSNRWDDARPRFEQALAASMASNGLDDALTKSLEAALDNCHYSFINSEPMDFRTIVGCRGVSIIPTFM